MTIKGSWRSEGFTKPFGFIVSDEPTGWDEGNEAGYGGHLVCESVPSEEIGHLIAAAPEMYRALKAVRSAAIFIKPERVLVDAALAKAEGRE